MHHNSVPIAHQTVEKNRRIMHSVLDNLSFSQHDMQTQRASQNKALSTLTVNNLSKCVILMLDSLSFSQSDTHVKVSPQRQASGILTVKCHRKIINHVLNSLGSLHTRRGKSHPENASIRDQCCVRTIKVIAQVMKSSRTCDASGSTSLSVVLHSRIFEQ